MFDFALEDKSLIERLLPVSAIWRILATTPRASIPEMGEMSCS
jgi:hypothetical protein